MHEEAFAMKYFNISTFSYQKHGYPEDTAGMMKHGYPEDTAGMMKHGYPEDTAGMMKHVAYALIISFSLV
jgi:hypothetical protein